MCGDLLVEYCCFKFFNKCDLCNKIMYIVEKMIDGNFGMSWQFVIWWEWYINNNFMDEFLKVNVMILFDKSYFIIGEICVIFKFFWFFKMIFEKFMDKGMMWLFL